MLFLSISRFHSDLVQEMQQKMKKYSQSPIWAKNVWGAAMEKPQLQHWQILEQEAGNAHCGLGEVGRPPLHYSCAQEHLLPQEGLNMSRKKIKNKQNKQINKREQSPLESDSQ